MADKIMFIMHKRQAGIIKAFNFNLMSRNTIMIKMMQGNKRGRLGSAIAMQAPAMARSLEPRMSLLECELKYAALIPIERTSNIDEIKSVINTL